MSRVKVLSAILGVLVVVAGVLYVQGYWDTWASKEKQLVEEIMAQLPPQAPEQSKRMFSNCVAPKLLALADSLSCPLQKGPINPQMVACINKDTNASIAALITVLSCAQQVKAAFPPQAAPAQNGTPASQKVQK